MVKQIENQAITSEYFQRGGTIYINLREIIFKMSTERHLHDNKTGIFYKGNFQRETAQAECSPVERKVTLSNH